jgi:hypothetical protein
MRKKMEEQKLAAGLMRLPKAEKNNDFLNTHAPQIGMEEIQRII